MPRRELGLRCCTDDGSTSSGLRGPWLGSKTGAALLAAEQAQEAQEEEAALTEAQYYQQLHALAAQQAHLHAELRGTFVLRAYKGERPGATVHRCC